MIKISELIPPTMAGYHSTPKYLKRNVVEHLLTEPQAMFLTNRKWTVRWHPARRGQVIELYVDIERDSPAYTMSKLVF